ncbi:MAG: hypothetical protein HYV03_00355 [Deltaproteobacteria bacterium]|nr:hypothetical protein [Deltaproteobacteria bacterium]
MADVDLDGEAEVLVPINTGHLLAAELQGNPVDGWNFLLPYRNSAIPTIGRVVEDAYIGGLTSGSGYDQRVLFRSQFGYDTLAFGEFAHEFDELAEIPLPDALMIDNVYVHPLVITPDGDGLDDAALFHYELSGDATIRIEVFDTTQQLKGVLFQGAARKAGENGEIWDGKLNGAAIPDGIYRLRLVAQSPSGIITAADANVIVGGVEATIEYPQDFSAAPWLAPSLFGQVVITGAAMDPNIAGADSTSDFVAYKLYYRPGAWKVSEADALVAGENGSPWLPVPVPVINQSPLNIANEPADALFPNSNASVRPIQHGTLGVWDTTGFANGNYTILLKALDSKGNVPGAVRFDSVVVKVGNIAKDNPFDASDPFDPANPNNPIYKGPELANVQIVGEATISKTHPGITVAYDLVTDESEAVMMRLTVYEGETFASAKQSVFMHSEGPKAAGHYEYTWGGKNNLGWPVSGGTYGILVEAESEDGTGHTQVDLTGVTVAKGYSASDVLTCDGVSVVNDPLNIGSSIEKSIPASVTISYALSKLATTTIEIYSGDPDNGGQLKKTLLKDHFAQSYAKPWYGETDAGAMLIGLSISVSWKGIDVDPVWQEQNKLGKGKVYVKITATSDDIGNPETVVCKVPDHTDEDGDGISDEMIYPVVHLVKTQEVDTIPASIHHLEGDDGEYVAPGDDPVEHAMVGSPDFFWRANAIGKVNVPFIWNVSAVGHNKYWGDYIFPPGPPLGYYAADSHTNTGYDAHCTEYDIKGQCISSTCGKGTVTQYTTCLNDLGGRPTPCVYIPLKCSKSYDNIVGIATGAPGSVKLWVHPVTGEPFVKWEGPILTGNFDKNHRLAGWSVKDVPSSLGPAKYRYGSFGFAPWLVSSIDPLVTGTHDFLRKGDLFVNSNDPKIVMYAFPFQFSGVVKTQLENEFTHDQVHEGGCEFEDWGAYEWDDASIFDIPAANVNGPHLHPCGGSGQLILWTQEKKDCTSERKWIHGLPGAGDDVGSGDNWKQTLAPSFPASLVASCPGVSIDTDGDGQKETEVKEFYSGSIDGYQLFLHTDINGYPIDKEQTSGYVEMSAFHGWLGNESGPTPSKDAPYNSGTAYVKLYDQYANGYLTVEDDDLVATQFRHFADGRIYGWVKDLNAKDFQLKTGGFSLADGYRLHHFDFLKQDPGLNIYTFSDVVDIDNWNVNFVYPSGDPVTAVTIKNPADIVYHTGDAANGKTNDHIYDTFGLTLTPTGVPKRFVTIYGTAPTGYQLFFFDADEEKPAWKSIPTTDPVTGNPVRIASGTPGADILGYWDVTELNGEHYTVVLKAKDPNDPTKINQVPIDVAIGEPITKGVFSKFGTKQVYSSFKRASIIFDPMTVKTPTELVTIAEVDPASAKFTLPSGAQPIGPIYNLKPDDIKLCENPDAATPQEKKCSKVALHAVFTKSELAEAFGIAESEYHLVNLYHLGANNELVPLFTEKHIGCAGIDLNDLEDIIYEGCTPQAENFVHFTALLDHFSQYMLVKRDIAGVTLTSPEAGKIYRESVQLSGQIYTVSAEVDAAPQQVPAIGAVAKVSYAPAGDPSAVVYLDTIDQPTFNTTWNLTGLDGTYKLTFEITTASGATNTQRFDVIVDNSTALSHIRVNGVTILDDGTITVNPLAIVEIATVDVAKTGEEGSGAQTIEYALDGGAFVTYTQPFTIAHLGLGPHTIVYRTTDMVGNVESTHTIHVTLELKTVESEPVSGVEIGFEGPVLEEGTSTWVSPATSIVLTAAGDDLDHIEYRLNSGDFLYYKGPLDLADQPEGDYILEYAAVTTNGLQGPIGTRRLTFDTTPPEVTLSVGVPSKPTADGYLITLQTPVTVSGGEGGPYAAGLSRIEYRIGEAPWQIYKSPLSFNQTTSLTLRAIDRVENGSPEKSVQLAFDDEAPLVNLVDVTSAFSPNGDGIKDMATMTVQLAENFAPEMAFTLKLIGPKGEEVVLRDAESVKAGTITTTWDGKIGEQMAPEGEYTYSVIAKDAEGNASPKLTGAIVLDVTPPEIAVVNAEAFQISPGTGINKDAMTVEYTVEDALLPTQITTTLSVLSATDEVTQVTQLVDTPPASQLIFWPGTNAVDNVVVEGSYGYLLSATDRAGNTSQALEGDATASGKVIVDTVPPVTTLQLIGNSFVDEAGVHWLDAAARIALSAADPAPGLGVKTIAFAWDAGLQQVYTEPIAPPKQGAPATLTYQAADWIENTEQVRSVVAHVDTDAPAATLTVTGPQETIDGVIYLGPATMFTIDAVDAGAGVDSIKITVDDQAADAPTTYESMLKLADAVMEDGAHTFNYWAVDQVKNTETAHPYPFVYDQTPPKTAIKLEPPLVMAEPEELLPVYYVTQATGIAFLGHGEREDVAITEYRIDNGAWQTAAAETPVTIAKEGEHLVEYRSTDRLGNVEIVRATKLIVDNTPPNTGASVGSTPVVGSAAVTDGSAVGLQTSDTVAGAQAVWFRLDDGAWQAYNGPIPMAGLSGPHTLSFYGVDQLGNQEGTQTLTLDVASLDMEQAHSVVPRVLVFMLQTIDLNEVTPRPIQSMLTEALADTNGFYHIVESYGEFVEQMRSDAYNIFVLASDAAVVKFDERPTVDKILRELRARVHKGDSVLVYLGGKEVTGAPWTQFTEALGGVGSRAYGRGQVIIDAATLGPSDRQRVIDAIVAAVPAGEVERFYLGEVVDHRLKVLNDSIHEAIVTFRYDGTPPSTADIMKPDGQAVLEKALPKGTPTVVEESMAMAPGASRTLRYIYRLSEQPFAARLSAAWAHGLAAQMEFPGQVASAGTLADLLREAIGRVDNLHDTRLDPVMAALVDLQRQIALIDAKPEAAPNLDPQVDAILAQIDEIAGSGRFEEVRYDLEEVLEVLGATYSPYFDTVEVGSAADDPLQDPNADTVQGISGGCGCHLDTPAEGSPWALALIFLCLLGILWQLARQRARR